MKRLFFILTIMGFFGNLSLFANVKVECNVKTKRVVLSVNEFNQLEMLGLSKEQFNALPEEVKRRIPQRLSKIDSLLIKTDFQKVTAAENKKTPFSNGEMTGNIIKMGGNTYKVLDKQDHLLGVFYKSKNGIHYTLLNARGKLLFNSLPAEKLLIAIIVLVVLSYTIGYIFFIALLFTL